MTTRQLICTFGLFLLACPAALLARTNILTTGISTSIDYDSPHYESVAVASESSGSSGEGTESRGNDYTGLAVRPLLRFLSEGRGDHLEMRAAPAIKYSLTDDETDWGADLSLSAAKSITETWNFTVSDSFVRSNDNKHMQSGALDSRGQDLQSTTPATGLAADRGRSLYWRNAVKMASEYTYAQESLVHVGVGYDVLRNDETEVFSYEDYDRSAFDLQHKHRFNSIWSTGADISLVRGEFTTEGQTSSDEEENKDLWEQHLSIFADNTAFLHHKISMNYNYTGTRYDEKQLGHVHIHEMQLVWRHELSQQLSTALGAGPSYQKATGQDANVGGNGKAEINYLLRNGRLAFVLEKGYDVDNFSGTGKRGFVDFWNTHLLCDYRLLENFSLNSQLAYRYEDREDPSTINSESNDPAEYNTEVITFDFGMRYTFMQYYSAGLNYTFIDQESKRIGDDYHDHRLLLTLSWEQEWLRW